MTEDPAKITLLRFLRAIKRDEDLGSGDSRLCLGVREGVCDPIITVLIDRVTAIDAALYRAYIGRPPPATLAINAVEKLVCSS